MPDAHTAGGTGSSDPAPSAAGRLVLIAGATSASGRAVARALVDAEARVVAVGRDPHKLDALGTDVPGITVRTCDLTDEAAVQALAAGVHETDGAVDGIVHLVGGWRGGGGLAGQTETDYRFLEQSLTALRVVSRAFVADLGASSAGRLAIVSSTAVARPLAGGANYAAVKAASETWTRAVAQGFAKAARDAGADLTAAATIFRAKALNGLEDMLAERIVALWSAEAESVNDTVILLEEQ